MSDLISFPCPNCNEHLEAPPDYAGRNLDCPGCGHELIVPPPVAASCVSCNEPLVSADAVICMSCGTNQQTGSQLKTKVKRINLSPELIRQYASIAIGAIVVLALGAG